MGELKLVKQDNFNGVKCDFHRGDGEVWMTRRQIGKSLGYSNPTASIRNIHNRNKERLDKNSTRTKVVRVEGGREVEREMFMYSRKGIFEICRWSQQDKANDFIDWVWEVIEKIMKTGSYHQEPQSVEDLIIMQAKSMKEIKSRMSTVEKKLEDLDFEIKDDDVKASNIALEKKGI